MLGLDEVGEGFNIVGEAEVVFACGSVVDGAALLA
jgi:hypothetical protein